METIIAAIISAIATIVAAWISSRGGSRGTGPSSVETPSEPEQEKVETAPPSATTNTTWWAVVMGLFALFIVFVGFFVHHDLPPMLGVFGTPVVVVVLALVRPTKPWTAAAFVFGVTTVAFLTEFGVKLSYGQSVRLSSSDCWLPLWFVLIAAVYAAIGAAICWWRRTRLRH